MLNNGFIVESIEIPHVVSPLSVAVTAADKKRLILDLRFVNKYIWKEKMTFEDWKTGIEYFDPNCFCFKFDLSKGYYHLDIFSEHQKYLGFSLNGKYYVYTVVPFGLSCAPFCFVKCLREIIKYWRFNGIKMVMFLDDGWGTNSNIENATQDANFVRNTLHEAGLVINEEKSIWIPVQRLEWVGLIWGNQMFSIEIPDRRTLDIKNTLL